ncbi:hypothetical protein LJC12_03940 [Odoribacter sp. OttesenSCG-928-J03]|nr:hypothetical protein [Odoribacter sp. OttesenSCG-928-J03]
MSKKAYCVYSILLFVLEIPLYAQEIKLDNLKEQFSWKNAFKISGGVSANATFYTGDNPARQNFTWMLSGHINAKLFHVIDLPFTCNINNLGGNYTYPSLPDRFSVHPSYKWITAHVGDISMSFSPYTLNAHQFTGAGVDIVPKNLPVKLSLMYGRLLKATDYDSLKSLGTAAYKRMGYGFKADYEKGNLLFGITMFHAHDVIRSLKRKPDSLQIYPQSNLALSMNATLRLLKNLSIQVENGLSYLTRDIRLGSTRNSSLWFLDRNASTKKFYAFHVQINYQLLRNTIGIGYERIDPDYRTLGAYYFTNDLEHLTFNFSRPFWKDKITFSFHIGVEHDNLNKNKVEQTNRWVGALNLSIAPMESLSVSLNYSNFQSYTHIRSPFESINSADPYFKGDTLNFSQLSQHLSTNINYAIGHHESLHQDVHITFSFQEASDECKGDTIKQYPSRFYNGVCGYTCALRPLHLRITTSFNLSYQTSGINQSSIYGPGIGLSISLLDNKMTTGGSVSYNISETDGKICSQVANLQWNSSLKWWKKHTITLAFIQQSRYRKAKGWGSEFTTTCSYSYHF